MNITLFVLTLGIMGAAPILATAQTATELNTQVTTMNNLSSSPGQTHVINKISGDFSSFLGSDANAVVTGLRSGTPITLTSTTISPSPTPGGLPVETTTTTVITPPTGHMGFGNVYISLALAKQQLASLDPPITQPTPEQLQAALTGGTITQTTGSGASALTTTTDLPGILTLRSQNMGWGQIAHKLGFKLGPAISSMKSANKSLAATSTTTAGKSSGVTTTASGKSNGAAQRGIVSASGKAQNNSGNSMTSGKSSGQGIVSAAGKGHGNAHGIGHGGIVTGSGGSAGVGGGIVSAGGGNGKGLTMGKGHNK